MTQKNAWFFWIAMISLFESLAPICSTILNFAILNLIGLIGIKIKYSYISGLIMSVFFITLAFILIYRSITRSDISAADMHSTISMKVMLIYLYFIGTLPAIGTVERGYGFSSEGLGLALAFPFIVIPFYCVLGCVALFFLCESVKNKNWKKSLFYCVAAILPLIYYFLLKINPFYCCVPIILAVLYFFIKKPKSEKILILFLTALFYCVHLVSLLMEDPSAVLMNSNGFWARYFFGGFFGYTFPFVFSISLLINSIIRFFARLIQKWRH